MPAGFGGLLFWAFVLWVIIAPVFAYQAYKVWHHKRPHGQYWADS